MIRSQALFAFLLVALLAFAVNAGAQGSPAPSGEPVAPTGTAIPGSAGDQDARRAAAREHFERGVKLLNDDANAAAYAEFMRSRELFPTRGNTQNAAVALRKLQRYDESLDLFETLLGEFGSSLPEADRAEVAKEIAGLRVLVGSIAIRCKEPGATVIVDGRVRGQTPVSSLRTSAGAHAVRVYKDGFLPFEIRVDVAGSQAAVVDAALIPLIHSGRLRVTESAGKPASIFVDNVQVGSAPWEGVLADGPHMVLLKGDGDLGTQPQTFVVKLNEVVGAPLTLEPLTSHLRVDVMPVPGAISIDGVTVGKGTWEGRLRTGPHQLVATENGFFDTHLEVLLASSSSETRELHLERDPSSPLWAGEPTAHVFVEAGGALALLPGGFGGDISGLCTGVCKVGMPLGVSFAAAGGYELPSGIAFALHLGYASLSASASNRSTQLVPTGEAAQPGATNDSLSLRGVLVGASAGIHRGRSFVWTGRLGLGLLLGSMHDTISGTFSASKGSYSVGPTDASSGATYFYAAPEFRAGYRIAGGFEAGVGVQAFVMMALAQPKFTDPWPSSGVSIPANVAYFPPAALAGSILFSVAPGLYARYEF